MSKYTVNNLVQSAPAVVKKSCHCATAAEAKKRWELLKCQANLFSCVMLWSQVTAEEGLLDKRKAQAVFSNCFLIVTVPFATLSSLSPGVSPAQSLVLPSLVCRRSWKKWWSGSTPGLTVTTRAVRAKELRPRRAPHRWHRSPKRKSNLSKSSLFSRKATVVMSQCGVGP